MGKRLEIKGANFSANAIEHITPVPLTKLVDFDGVCQGQLITYSVDLISTLAPDWVCFIQFAWQGGRTGEIRLFGFTSDDRVIQAGYTSNKQFYKAAERTYSASALHYFDNAIRKIGFKKQNGHVYVTFDGVSWSQTEFIPSSNVGTVYIWGTPNNGCETPNLTEMRLTVWNDPDYNIAPLFQ